MIFRLRSLLLFAGVMLGLTWILFPGPTTMTELFWRSGKPDLAHQALKKGLTQKNPGTELLLNSVDIHLSQGEPDKAVEALREVAGRHPGNLGVHERLAQVLTWSMRPMESLEVDEQILALAPKRRDVRSRLIHGHLYYGNNEKAVGFMVRDILKKDVRASLGDHLAVALTNLLQTLARERSTQGPSPFLDHAIERNYLLHTQYNETDRAEEDRDAFTIYAIENCLTIGRLDLAETFADELDDMAFAPDGTLALARVMSWNAMPTEALETLLVGLERFPGHEVILSQVLLLAQADPDSSLAAAAAAAVHAAATDQPHLMEDAALLTIATGDFPAALELRDVLEGKSRQRVEEKLLLAVLDSDNIPVLSRLVNGVDTDSASNALNRMVAAAHARLGNARKGLQLWENTLPPESADPNIWPEVLVTAVRSRDPDIIRSTVRAMPSFDTSPGMISLLRNAAMELATDQHYEPAFSILQQTLSQPPDPEDLKKLMLWAGYAQNLKLVSSASALISRHGMNDPELVLLAGEVNGWVGDTAGALPFATKVLRSSPCDASAALQAMAENNARAIPAAELILTCPDLSPQSALPPLFLLTRNGRETEAVKYLSERLTRAGSATEREKWLNTAENLGFTDLAYTGYAQLFQDFPDRPTYGHAAARLASWTERYRERADILAVLAAKDPGNAPAAIRAARALEEAGQPDRALPLYLRALDMAPETTNLRMHTLKLLGDLGRHEKRFEMLDAQRKDHPLTRPEIRFLLQDALALNRAEQVVKEAEQLEQNPNRNLQDLMQAVQILSRTGGAPRAEAALDRARRQSGNSPEELRVLGTAALYNNFLAVALACFEDILSRIPADGTALKGSAMIHAANNDAIRAISFFRRYLALYPEDAGARYQLGELLFVNGRQDEAQMEYARAIRTLKPDRASP